MRPSVSVLLSWQPAQLGTAGQALLDRAGDLQRAAADLTSIGSGLSGVWSGAAALAATAHHGRRSAEVDEFATVVHTAGQALLRAADAIGSARTSLQSALAAAAAAGCTVLDDGTVLPPARSPVPGGLTDEDRSAWQAEEDATAAAQAAGAARLAAQIRAALALAGAADDTSAAALSALQPPAVSPAPRPVTMGLTGGRWGPTALPACPVLPTPAPQPAQEPAEEDDGGWLSDLGHGLLDVVGLVPVLGEPADGINAIWYGAEGDTLNASLSAAAMIPGLGWGATGAKLGIKGAKAVDDAAGVAKAADGAEDATSVLRGPVRFNPPPGASVEEIEATREHVRRAQQVLEAGGLSPIGRVPVGRQLRQQATKDARRARAAAAKEGRPYAPDEHAGHVPDTTWTGKAQPPGGYQRLPDRVNSSIGGQSQRYPPGYQPTRFEYGGDTP